MSNEQINTENRIATIERIKEIVNRYQKSEPYVSNVIKRIKSNISSLEKGML